MRFVVGGYGTTLGVVELGERGFGPVEAAAPAARPSYVVVTSNGRYAYAALERSEGAVGAWEVTPEGPWRPLGEQLTGGADPCHLALSPDGRWLLAANYSSGSVCVVPVADDGSLGAATDLVQHAGPLGPVANRQDGPHAHQVVFTQPDLVLSCDLGLDAVIASRLDLDSGRLTEVARTAMSPGTGPRHLALSPDGGAAYVAGELSSTLTVCRVLADGELDPTQVVSTRPPEAVGENFPAAVVVTRDGRRVVASNRGDDTVALFDVGAALTLDMTLGVGGSWPRWAGFGATDDVLVVADERSDLVTTLRREEGAWQPGPSVAWPSPTCLAALPERA